MKRAYTVYADVATSTFIEKFHFPSNFLQLPECKEAVERMLQTLTVREEIAIRGRIGFDAGMAKMEGGNFPFLLGRKRKQTYEELGSILKVTRERARQIEAKGLRKLEWPSRRHHYIHNLIEHRRYEEWEIGRARRLYGMEEKEDRLDATSM